MGLTANECEISFADDESILAEKRGYTKNHPAVQFNSGILWYVNCISTKRKENGERDGREKREKSSIGNSINSRGREREHLLSAIFKLKEKFLLCVSFYSPQPF